MQLKDRDGIACDQCGTTYKTDFSYYSFDFRLVPVQENRRPSIQQIFGIQIVFSLDICTQCFDGIKKKIIENYSKTMTADTKHRERRQVGIVCELTGAKQIGTFNYYHCNVVSVEVKMSGQPNVCVNCHKSTYESDKPCACGSTDFVCPADTKVNDRYVEINLSEDAFRSMVDKAESMRKVAGQWATKS